MSTRISLDNFEEIYKQTYKSVLRLMIQKCSNINDVNDLVQNTYLELFEYLNKKKYIELENYEAYIMTIAKKQLSKYYGLLYKVKSYFINETTDYICLEAITDIDTKINFEKDIILKLDAKKVWKYIIRKNIIVIKIFYLYFYEEYKIKEISQILELNESNVKNFLYRTLKEVREVFSKEGDFHE